MKSYFKYELARAAGVSMRTFSRWLSQNTTFLAELAGMSWVRGMTPSSSQLCCREGTTARSYNYIGARHLMCRKQSGESQAKASDGGGIKKLPFGEEREPGSYMEPISQQERVT